VTEVDEENLGELEEQVLDRDLLSIPASRAWT
jgi:hypothetical protein